MAQIHTLTFTNKTGLCSSKRRVVFSFLTFCLFMAIIGICGYQLMYGEGGSTWTGSLVQLDPDRSRDDFRLPKNLKPFYYKIHLIPRLSPAQNFSIDASVQIDLSCLEATKDITLHLKNITVNEDSVRVWELSEGRLGWEVSQRLELEVIGHKYDPARDFYSVMLNESMTPGNAYRIYIGYKGTLNDELVGFYRSSYLDPTTNETRWIGVTQFSPTDARRAFPGFDEPSFKAEFQVSLGRLKNMSTLSNMNLLETEPMDEMPEWVWDHYAKSLPMSTYLVGFAVTDFAHRASNESLSRPKFQLWARSDAIDQTEYAGEIGPRILTYFEEYFGIEFPLPKVDMIGVPDHRFNAMENWGMITYRELAILFDPNYSSDANKRRIAEVVSHELGHQWFGNLVTPAWWSDLWLKEGFASYMAAIGVHFVEPEWEMLDLFVLNEVQNVFRLDALNNSHEISIPVGHPDEINRIFDDISYSKGCTIIRMMDHFLTSPTFKQGITNYLKKWEFNNTEQRDLWSCLTSQAHQDGTLEPSITVKGIMDTWTLQKGFPVVHVLRDYPTGVIAFTQWKFSLIPEYENSGYTWDIPVSVATGSGHNSDFNETKPSFWIFRNETKVERNMSGWVDVGDWLVVNVQTTGYYRVNYDTENWIRITDQLAQAPRQIHVVNRAQLLDDSLTLARASLLPYAPALNLTLYLPNEVEFLPWESYFNNMDFLFNMALNLPIHDPLKAYVTSLLADEYKRLGFAESETETVLERAHRIHILKWACDLDYSDCTGNALKLFADWMKTIPVPVNLRPVIYCTGIRLGTEKEWEFAKRKYLAVNVASEKDRILTALSCSRNETILNNYIHDAVRPGSFVRKQDSRNVLQRVASASDIGNRLTFEFLQKEWPRIKQYFGAGLSISRLINQGIAPKLKTESDLAAMVKFKSDYEGQFGFGERSVDEAIEIVRTNVHWGKKSYQAVADWLDWQSLHQDG